MALYFVKSLLQISDNSQDAILKALEEVCENEYIERTHQETADALVVDCMVVERYNKLGNEGMSSGSYSGISENFESDYSEQTLAMIRKRTRLKVL